MGLFPGLCTCTCGGRRDEDEDADADDANPYGNSVSVPATAASGLNSLRVAMPDHDDDVDDDESPFSGRDRNGSRRMRCWKKLR